MKNNKTTRTGIGGVKTLQGKIISRMNARKHGILADLLLEDETEYVNALREVIYKEYNPKGLYEETLADVMAVCKLRLNRILLAETELLLTISNPTEYDENSVTPDKVMEEITKGEVVDSGYKPIIHPEHIEKLETYLRYETSVLRNFIRNHKELKKEGNKPETTT